VTHPRETYGEGSRFEELGGYSRAVRSGPHVAVAGTAPIDEGVPVHVGDVHGQTLFALRKAVAAAEMLGARAEDVVRTRVLLAQGADWEAAIRAHAEVFGSIRPANTTYFVAGFIPDVLVEVEVEAIVS
jgi:enamine deaminase RidA (YjgF/YER057c/UK114 family)